MQEEEEGLEDDPMGAGSGGHLTLRRLVVWSAEPVLRLKTLAALVDVCQGTVKLSCTKVNFELF